jgi:hypothetical protein
VEIRRSALTLLPVAWLAVASLTPRAGAAEDDVVRPCDPLERQVEGSFDLQQAAGWLCRRLAGEEPTSPDGLAARLRVLVGGWADVSYLDNDLSGRDASFDLDHVNLHLDARLDERLQLFVEGEYEHDRDITGFPDERDFELEQGYADYAFSDAFRLRGGKFATKFGYWIPVHWSVNVDTIEPPVFEENHVVPEQQLGGRVHGRWYPDWARRLEPSIEYSAAVGWAEDGLDTGDGDGATTGADLRLWSGDRHFVGASYYGQENGDLDDRRETNMMLYGQIALPGHLLFRTEYLHQWRSSRPRFTRNADMVYAKLRWDFVPRAYFNYRFQFADDDKYGFTAKHEVHTLTLGFRPIPRVILKAETDFHEWDEGIRDYVAWGASLGLIF